MVVEQWLEFDMKRDLYITFIHFDIYFHESIDMMQKNFVFRLIRYARMDS